MLRSAFPQHGTVVRSLPLKNTHTARYCHHHASQLGCYWAGDERISSRNNWIPLLPRPFSPFAQFGREASSRKCPGCAKLLQFKNYGHYAFGNFQRSINILIVFPRSVPQHNHVSEFPWLDHMALFVYALSRQTGLCFSKSCPIS